MLVNGSQNAVESEVFEGEISEDAGIVRGVKLLGIMSRNRRNYDTPGVRTTAKVLLEGAHVYIDHPETPGKPRSYRDAFGVVKNVQYRNGQGHFGDLSFNPQHPLASQFIWDVKNNPKGLGMSVNARYKPGKTDSRGNTVVESLELIRSVDIVTKPATAEGIFESESADVEEEIMDLASLREKHADIVEQIEQEAIKKASQTSETADLQKKLKEAQEQLETLRLAEESRKLRDAVEADFGTIFDSLECEIEDSLRKDIVECACQMTEEARKPYRAVVEGIAKLIPPAEDGESDEDDAIISPVEEQETEEDEKPDRKAPGYRPGRSSSGKKFDLASFIGVEKKTA